MSDSISNAIDVAYQTEINIENKSTEQLTAEVNAKYWQAEGLARMSYTILADAGRRLIEIKNRIPHGQFETWCENNLEFSKSKAEKCMKLARKIDDENSLFSKTETFTDFEISTVWALLAAPEEVAAEVIENNDVSDMTVRELKDQISSLKKQIKEEQDKRHEAEMTVFSPHEEDMADMQLSLEHLNEELKSEKDRNIELKMSLENKDESIGRINDELASTKEKLKKEKAKLKELKDAQEEEVKKAIDAAEADIREKAKIDAAAEVHATLGQNAEEINRLEAEVEALEKKLANNSNELLMQFKVYMDELQDTYFKINDLITEQNEIDEEVGTKMAAALQKIIGEWRP